MQATLLSRFVDQQRMSIIHNERTENQLLVVDKQLKAQETKEGHGEPFFVFAMCAGIAHDFILGGSTVISREEVEKNKWKRLKELVKLGVCK